MKDIRIAYAVAFVSVLALLGWAGWKVVSVKGEAAQVNQVVSVQITEGEHASVDESKTAGYRNADEAARSRGVEQIWDQMADMIAEEDSGKAASATDSRAMNEEKAMKALLGEEAPAPAPAQKQSSGSRGGAPSRKSATPASVPAPSSEPPQSRADRYMKDYETASEIARRIYGTEGEGASGEGKGSKAEAENSEGSRPTRKVDSWSSGGGVSSLDGEIEEAMEEDRPVRCMFIRDEKLKSGQRVTLRLLEDAVIDGVVIPRDSHVSALCTIRDRLYLTVSSVEMNGRIRRLGLEGYDTDGSLGIYCPSVDGSAARTARDEALNIGQSALRGSIGNIASSVLRTGAGIIRSSSGNTTTVTVPSGYTIYLMKEEKR